MENKTRMSKSSNSISSKVTKEKREIIFEKNK